MFMILTYVKLNLRYAVYQIGDDYMATALEKNGTV